MDENKIRILIISTVIIKMCDREPKLKKRKKY